MAKRKTTEQFILDAEKIHLNKYAYHSVKYTNNKTKVIIICKIHGSFKQTPHDHLQGKGCPKCNKSYALTTKTFIEKATNVHNDLYDYNLVNYCGCEKEVKIICKLHGVFNQKPCNHLKGHGCHKCRGMYGVNYYNKGIPRYELYFNRLNPYEVACRTNSKDKNILEVKCFYCDKWHTPNVHNVLSKIRTINKNINGVSNFYCSEQCKKDCSVFNQQKYPKSFKPDRSREVQKELKLLRLEIDNHECQVCFSKERLECHHYDGVELNPVESADLDRCITICYDCHKDLHKIPGYTYRDFMRKPCKV